MRFSKWKVRRFFADRGWEVREIDINWKVKATKDGSPEIRFTVPTTPSDRRGEANLAADMKRAERRYHSKEH